LKILSAVYWRAGLHNVANPNSVMLKAVKSNKDTFLIALICTGGKNSSAGAILSGYVVEEMAEWFDRFHLSVVSRGKSIYWIKRRLMEALKIVNGDLFEYGEKNKINPAASLAVLIVWRRKYVILQLGEVRAYRFKRLFGFKMIERKIRYGKIRRGQGILICSNNFLTKLSKTQIYEALKPAGLRKEHQIRKRLEAIVDYSERRGGDREQAAIYVKF
jgi:serine/threonine protein phosphatase PrpC